MGKRMKTVENERKDRIMFHWELSPFKKKSNTGDASPIVYRPVLHRGKTLSTEAVIQEYLNESGLKAQLTPSQLQIIVNSPKAFRAAYMKESAYGLTGEIILYRNDAKPRRQSAHGSRFKVSFRKPPKGK